MALLLAGLASLTVAGRATAATDDLAACLLAKPTLQSYVHDLAARGWRQLAPRTAEHARATRATAEVVGTLRLFPVAFTAPEEVQVALDRIVATGLRASVGSTAIMLAKDGLWLRVALDTRNDPFRLTCHLTSATLPEVTRRLVRPGHNPSGEPLAYNIVSSGALDTPHVFAEIMYVRLFFQPGQHLLTGGAGIVTTMTYQQDATSI